MKPRSRIKLVVVAGAAAAIALLSLSAASASRSDRNAASPLLRVLYFGNTNTLDQSKVGGGGGILTMALEPLMKLMPDGKIVPWLAQKVTQPGKAVYVYHLRHGVKFWNGNELTAEDAANALNYVRFPLSYAAFFYNSVKSIVAKDRYTVVVTLKHPDASWRYAVASYTSVIFEKKFQEEHKTTYGQPGVLTMGTGPWKIDSYDPTSGSELSANPNWWGGKANFQHISVRYINDVTTQALAWRAGDFDVLPGVASPKTFEATSGTKLISAPTCQNAFWFMPTKTGPWADVHVRRAVAYTLNRSDLLKASGEYGTVSTTIIPLQHLKSIASKAQIDAVLKAVPKPSLAKAKEEMAKSAYPNGFSWDHYTVNYGPFIADNQVISNELSALGIKLNVHVVTTGEYAKYFAGPRESIGTIFSTSGCLTPDPGYYPTLILSKKNAAAGACCNFSNYTGVDTLVQEGNATAAPAKRFAIYTKLLKQVQLDVPAVPVYVTNTNLAIARKFKWPTYSETFAQRAWPLEIKPS